MAIEDLAGRAILIVDDEEFFLASLVEGLHALVPGLRIVAAHEGLAALRACERERFDAIVTDVQMPGLDGFGLLAALRERAIQTPVLVMSAYGRPAFEREVEFAGGIDHLDKPLDFDRLLDALVAAIRRPLAPNSDCDPNPPQPRARPTNRASSEPNEGHVMANIQQTLNSAMELQGAMGAALVDWENGMCLGTAGSGLNLELAAAGNTEVVRAKMRVMKSLGIRGVIEDILITLEEQYHLIRPTGSSLFLYLVLDRKSGNLALARMKLAEVGRAVTL
ncbi:response regulator [Nannocystaceae bacterium ST9]